MMTAATQERVYRVGVNLKFGGGDAKTTPIGKRWAQLLMPNGGDTTNVLVA